MKNISSQWSIYWTWTEWLRWSQHPYIKNKNKKSHIYVELFKAVFHVYNVMMFIMIPWMWFWIFLGVEVGVEVSLVN
jgi:hypothetical protein